MGSHSNTVPAELSRALPVPSLSKRAVWGAAIHGRAFHFVWILGLSIIFFTSVGVAAERSDTFARLRPAALHLWLNPQKAWPLLEAVMGAVSVDAGLGRTLGGPMAMVLRLQLRHLVGFDPGAVQEWQRIGVEAKAPLLLSLSGVDTSRIRNYHRLLLQRMPRSTRVGPSGGAKSFAWQDLRTLVRSLPTVLIPVRVSAKLRDSQAFLRFIKQAWTEERQAIWLKSLSPAKLSGTLGKRFQLAKKEANRFAELLSRERVAALSFLDHNLILLVRVAGGLAKVDVVGGWGYGLSGFNAGVIRSLERVLSWRASSAKNGEQFFPEKSDAEKSDAAISLAMQSNKLAPLAELSGEWRLLETQLHGGLLRGSKAKQVSLTNHRSCVRRWQAIYHLPKAQLSLSGEGRLRWQATIPAAARAGLGRLVAEKKSWSSGSAAHETRHQLRIRGNPKALADQFARAATTEDPRWQQAAAICPEVLMVMLAAGGWLDVTARAIKDLSFTPSKTYTPVGELMQFRLSNRVLNQLPRPSRQVIRAVLKTATLAGTLRYVGGHLYLDGEAR